MASPKIFSKEIKKTKHTNSSLSQNATIMNEPKGKFAVFGYDKTIFQLIIYTS